MEEIVTLDPQVSKIILNEEQALFHGKQICVMYIDTKKDEKRSLDKVAACSTRIFQNCNFVVNFLLRKYFQSFIAHCYDNCVMGP